MGGALPNPYPTFGDLLQAKDKIKGKMKIAFLEVAKDMGDINAELLVLRSGIEDAFKLISDKEFYDGVATIDAH